MPRLRPGVAVALASLVAAVATTAWLVGRREAPAPPARPPRPVIFVHGMGGNAADIGVRGLAFDPLLPRIAAEFPRPGICQRDAQPRPWDGSPCVFRYVGDRAVAGEPGAACPCDSQSGLEENARKLAAEIGEVFRNAGGARVVLIGYSMGGAIIRAYLGLFSTEADRQVEAAILIDPVTTGSWAFGLDVREEFDDPGLRLLAEILSRAAAANLNVDLDRPAYRDLQPLSEIYRRVAELPLPATVSTYTFWGNIRVDATAGVLGLHRELDAGDLALLAGDPDPSALPPLGGQRFLPDPGAGAEALEVPHSARMTLGPGDLAYLASACLGLDPGTECLDAADSVFDVPNAHWRISGELGTIRVDSPELGGEVSLEDAILAAVRRNA